MIRFLLLILCCLPGLAAAQLNIDLQLIAGGLTSPTGLAHAGDDRLFVTEQGGLIRIIDKNGRLVPTPFLDIRQKAVFNRSERGLLGLAFHPDYDQNGYLFINYTNNQGNTVVSRFSSLANTPNQADPNSEVVVLEIDQPYSNHNGGDLNFGPDGYLYISSGDGGLGGDPLDAGQDLNSLLGKILRIDVDSLPYKIPADNPFAQNANARGEIWSWGLRNPWQFSFDRKTGDMWVGDVGQNDLEEVNFQPGTSSGGENYGWRCFEASAAFNLQDCGLPADYELPVFEYPNLPSVGQSITGGYVYRGNDYPLLRGYYIVGDYETGHLWTIRQNGQVFTSMMYRQSEYRAFSAFGENAEGELFALDHQGGRLYQVAELTPTSRQGTVDEFKVEVYPNPVESSFSITLDNPQGSQVTIELLDVKGKLLKTWKNIAQTPFKADMSEFSAGKYIVRVKGERFQAQRVLLKK